MQTVFGAVILFHLFYFSPFYFKFHYSVLKCNNLYHSSFVALSVSTSAHRCHIMYFFYSIFNILVPLLSSIHPSIHRFIIFMTFWGVSLTPELTNPSVQYFNSCILMNYCDRQVSLFTQLIFKLRDGAHQKSSTKK